VREVPVKAHISKSGGEIVALFQEGVPWECPMVSDTENGVQIEFEVKRGPSRT